MNAKSVITGVILSLVVGGEGGEVAFRFSVLGFGTTALFLIEKDYIVIVKRE